jgi:hypothetical protein
MGKDTYAWLRRRWDEPLNTATMAITLTFTAAAITMTTVLIYLTSHGSWALVLATDLISGSGAFILAILYLHLIYKRRFEKAKDSNEQPSEEELEKPVRERALNEIRKTPRPVPRVVVGEPRTSQDDPPDS